MLSNLLKKKNHHCFSDKVDNNNLLLFEKEMENKIH